MVTMSGVRPVEGIPRHHAIPDEPQTTDASAPSGATPSSSAWGGWLRLGAIGLSFLVIGFVGGWIVRGDQGPTTVLAPPDEQEQAAITSATEPTGGTTTAEEAPSAATAPPRDEIILAVLNGGDVAGLAANTAEQAEELGYVDVEAGNAPPQTVPTTVYHVPGQLPAAQRVADDMQIGPVEQLPTSGELADAVPDGARVVIVLGS
jgi:hypothetical protein